MSPTTAEPLLEVLRAGDREAFRARTAAHVAAGAPHDGNAA